MLRLSKLTDYATVLLASMARDPQLIHNAAELAAATRVSPPTARKTLKILAQAGLVESVRGVNGGYRLEREPRQISVADIVNAMEGPIAMTQCSSQNGLCSLEPHCRISRHWQLINRQLINSLQALSLADLNLPAPRLGA